MNALITQATQDNFKQEVLQSSVPVLVDFWADWCGPCRMQNPILEELADELQGKVLIAKVNVDDNQELAQEYQIVSIPTMLIFQNGKMVHQFVGVQSKDSLLSTFEKLNLT